MCGIGLKYNGGGGGVQNRDKDEEKESRDKKLNLFWGVGKMATPQTVLRV
jgi:hypothetical protein